MPLPILLILFSSLPLILIVINPLANSNTSRLTQPFSKFFQISLPKTTRHSNNISCSFTLSASPYPSSVPLPAKGPFHPSEDGQFFYSYLLYNVTYIFVRCVASARLSTIILFICHSKILRTRPGFMALRSLSSQILSSFCDCLFI